MVTAIQLPVMVQAARMSPCSPSVSRLSMMALLLPIRAPMQNKSARMQGMTRRQKKAAALVSRRRYPRAIPANIKRSANIGQVWVGSMGRFVLGFYVLQRRCQGEKSVQAAMRQANARSSFL